MIPIHIIEAAVRGGYKSSMRFQNGYTYAIEWQGGDDNEFISRTEMNSRLCLDPAFWRALGKELGWGSFYDTEGMPRYHVPAPQGWYPITKTDSGYDDQAWEGVALYFLGLIISEAPQEKIDAFWGDLLANREGK